MNMLLRDRFLVLLAALALMFLVAPCVEILKSGPFAARLLLTCIFIVLLLAALFALRSSKRSRFVALCLLAPAVVFEGATVWGTSEYLVVTEYFFSGLFLAYVIFTILRTIFEQQRVTANMIYAALCAYLLLGIFWSVLYSTVWVIDHKAFSYPFSTEKKATADQFRPGAATSASAIYYSFVTMTTLGYGDVIPISSAARSLSALQAVVGQLYLAVLVARLVGLQIVHSRETDE
jgi:voltage-gated potassium channel